MLPMMLMPYCRGRRRDAHRDWESESPQLPRQPAAAAAAATAATVSGLRFQVTFLALTGCDKGFK